MKQMIKIIQQSNSLNRARQLLDLDQDYHLLSLDYGIKNHDELEIERSKRRLFEIHVELRGLELHEQLQ